MNTHQKCFFILRDEGVFLLEIAILYINLKNANIKYDIYLICIIIYVFVYGAYYMEIHLDRFYKID